eukprot:558480-Ditylum_brightwellii.AAC.1
MANKPFMNGDGFNLKESDKSFFVRDFACPIQGRNKEKDVSSVSTPKENCKSHVDASALLEL